MGRTYVIGVVGNPNCGKTTLFNALTGAKQQIGNWPGVTVERKTGRLLLDGLEIELVDLPGTYSLEVSDEDMSVDERIARDFAASHTADLIINIVDASNLERNLYLTSQLLEMKVPVLVALTMMDAAEKAGLAIDVAALQAALGCPAVPLVAPAGRGLPQLRRAIADALVDPQVPATTIPYAPAFEEVVADFLPNVRKVAERAGADPRWLAVRLLEGDGLARKIAGNDPAVDAVACASDLEDRLGDDIDIVLADARYGFASQVVSGVVQRKGTFARSVSDRIDRVVLDRILGIPIFLLAMHLMFVMTINVGGAFIDAFDIVTGAVTVDGFGAVLGGVGAPDWLTVLLADGIGGGIQVVATFIPIVGCLFLFLSILEDSGYMARAAFVMDRFLRSIGLPGKAFVPMIVGFGCTVPAVMATRTLDNERDRKTTIAMAPFMSCGARLPVYALFGAAFFAAYAQYVVFVLYIFGILVAILTGLILKHTLLRGEAAPFVMELPPYRLPTVRGVLIRSWDRTRGFAIRAGRVIVPMVLVLNTLNSVGMDGSLGNEDSEQSALSEIGRTISPLFSPFGVTGENWPASVGIFTGFLAKEAVVGTLDSLYGALGEQARSDAVGQPVDGGAEEGFDFAGTVRMGLATIPANLADAMGSWLDPIGLDVGDVSSVQAAAAEQEVGIGTFGAMAERFDGAAGAFAYLLFILLYMPCVAAIAAVRRETTLRWTLFVAGWTTGVAYVVATLFYQIATFARTPDMSLIWIAGCIVVSIAAIVAMRIVGHRAATRPLGLSTASVAGE